MRHPYYLAFFIFLLASCATLTAPQTTKQRLAYADSGFTAIVNTASDMREAGVLTDEYVGEVDAALQAGSASLDVAWAAEADIDKLLAIIRAEERKPTETEQEYIARKNKQIFDSLKFVQGLTLKLQKALQEMQDE